MENASKALLIAGGMLLAMMILVLVISLATTITDVTESQDRKKLTEQIVQFNKEYEAYNKTKMFGTDVITVVNKAINHNKTIGVTEANPYYINIKIKLNQTFETTVIEVDNTKTGSNQKKLTGTQITTQIKNTLENPSNSYGAYLSNDRIYELGIWQQNGSNFIMDNNFMQFFAGDTTDKTKTTSDKKRTYIMYSALTNFKTAIFSCKDIDGDGVAVEYEEGRVKSMEFSQN